MFKKLIIAAVLFTGLMSCGKSKSGFKYSQDIVAKERSLQPDINATESKVKEFAMNNQYDSIGVAGAHMEEVVQKKIDEINKMPLPNAKGASEFKAAVLRYFDYIKSMYSAYKQLGKAETDEARTAELENIQKLANDKNEVITDMQKAQRKYADDNGFKIEN